MLFLALRSSPSSLNASKRDVTSSSSHRGRQAKRPFFQRAVEVLTTEDLTYFPIQLNFETYEDCTHSEFYDSLTKQICKEVERIFQGRGEGFDETLKHFLNNAQITNHLSMMEFFEQLQELLKYAKVVLIIDEFDGIPPIRSEGFSTRVSTYLYLSRHASMSLQSWYHWCQEHRTT